MVEIMGKDQLVLDIVGIEEEIVNFYQEVGIVNHDSVRSLWQKIVQKAVINVKTSVKTAGHGVKDGLIVECVHNQFSKIT